MLGIFHEAGYPKYGELAQNSHFSKAELKSMFQRFRTIAYCPNADLPESLWLTKEKFMQQSELVFCSLAGRAFDVETDEAHSNGYIDFETYVRIFSHFSPKASLDEKKTCTYSTTQLQYVIYILIARNTM